MKFFTGDDFKLNENLEYTTEIINRETVVYVDNLYTGS